MDLSSLTEAQQQQFQQLHQQFQEHQIQRQKQQQESAASYSSYDPSSLHHFQSYNQPIQQTYDQSYHHHPSYSHYPPQQQHHHHHHHQQQQQQQQHYPYYHHDYSNAYHHHHHQSYSQTDNTPPIHPPGVSSEAAAVASQNAYYPPHTQPLNHPSTSSDYPGLNPAAAAAVAALSELTHFAGNMDAAERARAAGVQDRHWNPNNELGVGGGGGMYSQMPMPLQHAPYPVHFGAGRSSYNRGGVKRGARTFRGSSRVNLGNRHSRPDGPVPYSRGRGRGGGRRFPSRCDSLSTFPEASAQKSDEASTHVEVAQPGKTGADELPQATPASASSAAATTTTSIQATRSTKQPPGISWCEICRLDCTTPDNLEQHKKGKKHKKNLVRFEVVQNSRNHTSNPTPSHDLPRIQTEKITTGDQEATAQPENIHPNETINQPDLKSLATETTTPDDQVMDSEQQNKVQELAEVPEVDKDEGTTERQKVDQFDTRKLGLKRNLRGGRGGKRMRMAENKISRVIKPPKEVLPFSCDLCNVKCDTQAVLEFHFVGKKHLSKVRRFQGHQAVYGPVGLQALYPSNPTTQSVFVPQEHHQQQQAHVNISQQPIVANSMPLDGHAVAEMQQEV